MYDTGAIQMIRDNLLKHKQTLAVAESVTSGHLQAALSLAESASAFFQGGITAYNIIQKYCHLHITPAHAIACNCVSKTVAAEMAQNTCKLFSCIWGIGITGYASILPGHEANGLYACYSFAFRGKEVKSVIVHAKEDHALATQLFYANIVLKDFAATLEGFIEEDFINTNRKLISHLNK